MPVRVRLSRKAGWRMPDNTVSVARPGKFGNPYPVAATKVFHPREAGLTAAQAVAAFRTHLLNSPGLREMVLRQLSGKNLACWCPLDQPCHADVLLELANKDNP